MPAKPGSVVVLVCPQCGKKYKGDANKPDARYQCPIDQSTLIRLDTEAAAALRQARSASGQGQGPTSPTSNGEPEKQEQHEQFPVTPEFPGEVSPPPSFDAPPPDLMTTPYGNGAEESPAAAAPTPQPAATDAAAAAPAPEPRSKPAPRPSAPPAPVTPRASKPNESGSSILTGFEQRRSVVAALEKLGGKDAVTGELVPVFKYEVKNKLGAGGMGEVFKVLDRDLRREVAMKRLRPQPGGENEEDLLRFIKEAQATGRLEHPNIVPVHDLGVDGEGRVYFTLKYVKGVSLKEVIRGRRDATQLPDKRKYRDVFSARQMIEILISVCNAVAYANSKEIIHRDLKPDNIMLGDFGEVLVMDWGLAKFLQQGHVADADAHDGQLDMSMRASLDTNMTMEGAIAGTPAYMSPEQAGGRISELDQRTDVYSLGAILYEILAGEPPYKGTSALEVVRMVTSGPPEPLNTGVHGFRPIPRELKAICEKAMAHDPNARYANAGMMRDDLLAYLEDQPVSCCPDTPSQKTLKWVKRNRHRVTTSAVTAVAVLAFVFLCWFGYKQVRVYELLKQAQKESQTGKERYEYMSKTVQSLPADDPYRMSLMASEQRELASIYREHLNAGIELALKALDLSHNSSRAHQFLAESYMQLWRLALAEDNQDLMKVYRAEVLRYAPSPDQYQHELDGFGSLQVTVDPPSADVYLFRYETLHSNDAHGSPLPPRLIPVPYDPVAQQSSDSFLQAEAARAQSGNEMVANTHSIYRLDPTPESRLGTGSVSLQKLAPGSYMLLLLDPSRLETHVPFSVEREGNVVRKISMPKAADVPAGFAYIAGGPAWVGGSSANALPRHIHNVEPFLMAFHEITMDEYSQFLKSIGGAAKEHMPRDFGKPLATLSANGLAPTDGSDAQKFLQSPVRGISYNDAQAYVAWRSQHDGVTYRLPTEYEWESACRGADGRTYSWGNVPGSGLAIVLQGYNDSGTSMDWNWQDYRDESPWGIHELAGSVAEWTGSPYQPTAKPNDPLYGQYTIKGDAWSLPPDGLQCAFRTSGQADYFHPTIGFRLAADWPVKRTGTPQQDQPQQTDTNAQPALKPFPKPPPKPKMSHAQEIIHKMGMDNH